MFKLKFSMEAGALTRRHLRKELEKYCFTQGLELTLRELKGFWESTFLVTIQGPAGKGHRVKADIETWGHELARG